MIQVDALDLQLVLLAHVWKAVRMCPPGRPLLILVSGLLLLLRAPVAVGVAAVSTSEMLTSGLKGRGFSVLHTYQDHLWWVQCSFCFTESCVGGENMGSRFRSERFGPTVSLGKLLTPDINFLAEHGETIFFSLVH